LSTAKGKANRCSKKLKALFANDWCDAGWPDRILIKRIHTTTNGKHTLGQFKFKF